MGNILRSHLNYSDITCCLNYALNSNITTQYSKKTRKAKVAFKNELFVKMASVLAKRKTTFNALLRFENERKLCLLKPK